MGSLRRIGDMFGGVGILEVALRHVRHLMRDCMSRTGKL
jgi:hypothetical protein